MSARQARDTRHTFSTAEQAFHDLVNLRSKLDAFLVDIHEELIGLGGVHGCHTDQTANEEAAYLRETVTEHLRGQFADAFDAAGEWFERDPMVAA